MRKIYLFMLICVPMLFSSCAKHIYVNYQTQSENTGTVIVKPNRSTERTYVTINDQLIVDKKFVKSVTIDNVPYNDYMIHYTSENMWYKDKLNAQIRVTVEDGREITKLIEVPPYSVGYWIYVSGMAILPWLIVLAQQ